MEEVDKTLKPERTIELNETTDGFLTQINHINDETTHSLNSNNDSILNSMSTNKGYILMDPSVLIPNEGKKSKGKNSLNYSRSYASIDTTSLVDNKKPQQQADLAPVSPPPPPTVIVPNLNTNSFVNPEHSMSFVNSANSELKDFVKKTTVNTAVTAAKLQSFSMNGTLKQPSLSRSNMDNKSNFSRAFQFLPNILSDGNHFPNRKNFHHRRIFLRYLTTKLEKENEFANEIKSNILINQHIQHQSNTHISSSKKSTGKSRKNFLIDDSGAYYEDQQIFVDLKKASSPPPSQLERYATKLKQPSNLTQSNLRSKSLITNNNNSNSERKSTQLDDETKSLYTKPLTINTVKNVVDLNEISESSRLSGHYFSGVIQTKKKLADLNLNELWPSSRMYKVSIKGNSWVNSFKARTFANEVNTNFRNTLESGYSSSRMDAKRNITLLPNIKQIF